MPKKLNPKIDVNLISKIADLYPKFDNIKLEVLKYMESYYIVLKIRTDHCETCNNSHWHIDEVYDHYTSNWDKELGYTFKDYNEWSKQYNLV
jgi:hypothetical protein